MQLQVMLPPGPFVATQMQCYMDENDNNLLKFHHDGSAISQLSDEF